MLTRDEHFVADILVNGEADASNDSSGSEVLDSVDSERDAALNLVRITLLINTELLSLLTNTNATVLRSNTFNEFYLFNDPKLCHHKKH